jgi:class 3 adenylate cyclase
MSLIFTAGHAYENVYLMSADAAGHSNIVASNPRDRVTRAFDLLEARVAYRIETVSESHGCGYAKLWHWHGDGGLIAFYDSRESTARDAALDAAKTLVTMDLRNLADEFAHLGIEGELHLRVGVHKGTIASRGEGAEGAIRSPDINFASHLEAAAPPDTVAISGEVFRTAGAHYSADYHRVGGLEGHQVYLATNPGSDLDALRAWIRSHGIEPHTRIFGLPERPSQLEKARLLDTAAEDVVEIGTALHTSSDYLVTTQRPDLYRQAALRYLNRGGVYRCYLMDPDSDDARRVAVERGEDLAQKVTRSLHAFEQFKNTLEGMKDRLRVYQIPHYPGMTIFGFDMATPTGLILYSHYLPAFDPTTKVERGDMPHYLASPNCGALYESIRSCAEEVTGAAGVRRVL